MKPINIKRFWLPILFSVLVLSLAGNIWLFWGKGSRTQTEDREMTLSASHQHEESGKQLYSCGMHPQVIMDKPGNCPICGMKLTPIKGTGGEGSRATKERKIKYWVAPMDPTYISDRPGKSPMGMDLVPVYEGEAEESGSIIRIDPVIVQNMGVKTQRVKRMDLRRKIRTVGRVDYDEKKLYRINTKISGWLEKLYVNYTGQVVKKGEPLLEIYSPELVTTQEEFLLALRNRELLGPSSFKEISQGAQELLESTRRRLKYWDIPDEQIKQLEEGGKISKTMTLVAPVTGVVVHKNAEEGLHVMPGMDLYRIADLSTVWVYVDIYEYELPWVKVGQRVEMELSYTPGKVYRGNVIYIYPYLDPKTRTAKVRLEFANPGMRLKPDMYANIKIQPVAARDVAVVPEEAVIHSGERTLVFLAKGEGRFESRDVTLGLEGEGGYYEVLEGLEEGDVIVTSAQFLLDSESKLQEAIQKMLAAKGGHGQQGHETMKMEESPPPTGSVKPPELVREQ
ncbi:efflux RND transporter periplasmic adaptor subunit [candidate division KSB1 bacterium]|nr:efflux RND transporter periplasmic adaptor subunit [candidate division KSB1 bacterium]